MHNLTHDIRRGAGTKVIQPSGSECQVMTVVRVSWSHQPWASNCEKASPVRVVARAGGAFNGSLKSQGIKRARVHFNCELFPIQNPCPPWHLGGPVPLPTFQVPLLGFASLLCILLSSGRKSVQKKQKKTSHKQLNIVSVLFLKSVSSS